MFGVWHRDATLYWNLSPSTTRGIATARPCCRKRFAYPVGRDVIQRQLTLAGARLTSLSLGRPDRHSADTVIDIYWTGDVARTVGGVVPPGGAVHMSLLAVQSDQKQVSGAGVAGQVAHRAYRLTRPASKPISPEKSSLLLICPSRGPYSVITGYFGATCPVIDPLGAHRSTNSEWDS